MSIHDLSASLDLKQNLNIFATCKQLDNLNLILKVYDNSVQADLANYNVRLKAMKSDNIPLIQEHIGITPVGNIITIAADEQLTTTSGKTLIELQFIDKSTGKKKATFNLVLMVVPSTTEINGTISMATYTLLEELENKLDQAGDFLENIDEAIELNQELITQNTNATSNVSSLTTQNNNATQNISDLETQNSNASTNIPSLTSLNTQAEANIGAMESFGDVTQLTQNVTALKNEVEIARNGEVSLDARLDKFDTSLSELAKPNLLINGDFQVCQRSETLRSFTFLNGTALDKMYCFDRWYGYMQNANIVVSDSQTLKRGVRINNTGANMARLSHFVESRDVNTLKGKKCTLSFKALTNGMAVKLYTTKESVLIDGPINVVDGLNKLTFTMPSDFKGFFVQYLGIGIVELAEFKLEEGELVTPFVPRLYGEELSLCLRYYRTVNSGNLRGQFWGTNSCRLSYDVLPYMRTSPSVVFPSSGSATVEAIGSGNKTGGACNLLYNVSSSVLFDVNGLTASSMYQQAQANFSITLDAEIY